MLVLCVYLSAMAGITMLCYVFRKRPDETGKGTPSPTDLGQDGNPVQDASVSNIVATTINGNSSGKKVTGRNALTAETQEKIQKVLDFVNTPSDELVLESEDNRSSRTSKSKKDDRLQLPVYSSSKTKKPKEVVDDLKQSKAKVEAWISELEKVINNDEMEQVERHEKRPRGSGVIKPHILPVNSEARKTANNERLAKVKDEMAKRRVALVSKTESSRRREEDERPLSARKKWQATPVTASSGPSYRRDVVEVPKRATDTNTNKKRPWASGSTSQRDSSPISGASAEDHKAPPKKLTTTKEETASKAESIRGRTSVKRPSVTQKTEAVIEDNEITVKTRTRPEPVKLEPVQKVKPLSAFEARMKYVPPAMHSRSPSPTRSSEVKTRSPLATSKIPLMVNSRVRPPVARTVVKPPREPKGPPPPVQKPKKSIRITNDPPLPATKCFDISQAVEEIVLSERRSSSHSRQEVTRERSCVVVQDDAGVGKRATKAIPWSRIQDDAMVGQRPSNTRRQETVESDCSTDCSAGVLPELNIIDVVGSRSCCNPQADDIHAEVHFASESAARIAKSGPLRLNENHSFDRVKSLSNANLRSKESSLARLRVCQPASVSKTVQLPAGTENNVTVYFSVTMPRRANSDINWNGHGKSDQTIALDDAKLASKTDVEAVVPEEELYLGNELLEETTAESLDAYDHSKDDVFTDEINNFRGSNIEGEIDYQSSTDECDEKDFDSCDE